MIITIYQQFLKYCLHFISLLYVKINWWQLHQENVIIWNWKDISRSFYSPFFPLQLQHWHLKLLRVMSLLVDARNQKLHGQQNTPEVDRLVEKAIVYHLNIFSYHTADDNIKKQAFISWYWYNCQILCITILWHKRLIWELRVHFKHFSSCYL